MIPPIRMVYTNYRGETRVRTIVPASTWYGTSPYHPHDAGSQWFLKATDVETGMIRDFAMKDIVTFDDQMIDMFLAEFGEKGTTRDAI